MHWLLSRELNTFMWQLFQLLAPQLIERQKQEDIRLADAQTEHQISVSGKL